MFAACAERFQAETRGRRASAKLREEDRAWRETVPSAETSKRYLPCVLYMQSCSEKVSRDAGVVVEIFFYQVLIFTTLFIVRFVAPKYIEVACFFWTAFTLLNLSWLPLIALQLLVVWGTYAAICPEDSAGPTGKIDPSPNSSRERKTESTPTRKNERREVSGSLSSKPVTGASAGKNSDAANRAAEEMKREVASAIRLPDEREVPLVTRLLHERGFGGKVTRSNWGLP